MPERAEGNDASLAVASVDVSARTPVSTFGFGHGTDRRSNEDNG